MNIIIIIVIVIIDSIVMICDGEERVEKVVVVTTPTLSPTTTTRWTSPTLVDKTRWPRSMWMMHILRECGEMHRLVINKEGVVWAKTRVMEGVVVMIDIMLCGWYCCCW